MNINFRKVEPSDLNKFRVWYERIGGSELFSNFIPSTFVSLEESKGLLWFIILDDEEEIGTIWFERRDQETRCYDLGIYLNRIDLFGNGIGKEAIHTATETILSREDARELCLDVRKGNFRAIRCYKKLGFATIHEGEKVTASGKIKFQRMRLSRQEPDHRTFKNDISKGQM
jgi:RimJ/RimL family protein N-acetyltransferase